MKKSKAKKAAQKKARYVLLFENNYIWLGDKITFKQAMDDALEYLWEEGNCFNNLTFNIIEVAKVNRYNTEDYRDLFKQKFAQIDIQEKEQEERLEREQYERLKKKFEK